MSRKYAFINNNIVTKIDIIDEDQYRDYIYNYQNIIDIQDTLPEPQVGWKISGNKLIPSAPLTVDANYINKNIVVPASNYINSLIDTYRGENILMGITQLNKTAPVLGVFVKKIQFPGWTEPLSVDDTIAKCSFILTIDILDYHLDNIDNYADLSPFITYDRILSLRNNIATYFKKPIRL